MLDQQKSVLLCINLIRRLRISQSVPTSECSGFLRLMIPHIDYRRGPYSQFRVGSALLTHDGHIVTGANVENASYPVGTCAERCAAAKAVADGHRSFRAMVVSTDVATPAWPCGMCRQFLREFCSLEAPLFSFGEQALEKTHDWSKGPLPLDAPEYAVMMMKEVSISKHFVHFRLNLFSYCRKALGQR